MKAYRSTEIHMVKHFVTLFLKGAISINLLLLLRYSLRDHNGNETNSEGMPQVLLSVTLSTLTYITIILNTLSRPSANDVSKS